MTDADSSHADLAACERALHELLCAILAYDRDEAAQDRRRQLQRPVPFSASSFERMAFRSLTTDPVRGALREGVKRIGREMHRLGGTGAMLASLDRVAEMDPAHAGRRGAIVDAAWNGIGAGDDRWWS